MYICSYWTAGFPDLKTSIDVIKILYQSSQFVEIGIPFSDPIADGPTIQFSSAKSLQNGFKVKDVFKIVEEIVEKEEKIYIMSYLNPILAFGIERFADFSKNVGVEGIIIPDLPPEESEEIRKILKKYSLNLVFFIAPTTPPKRIKFIDKITSGFLYYVSRKGTTGEQDKLPEDIKERIKNIKKIVKNLVFVGFGISSLSHVKELSEVADGVILGSILIRKFINGEDLKNFLYTLKNQI